MQSGNNSREKQVYNNLKNKYIGIGDADTKRGEFLSNIKKDTYFSLISYDSINTHLSIGLNKPKRLIQNDIIDKMRKC